MAENAKEIIEKAQNDPEIKKTGEFKEAVLETLEKLDKGEIRVAEKIEGEWQVNSWIQSAVLAYFGIRQMEVMEMGPFEFYDKIPLKKGLKEAGVRAVPPATARYGCFIESGAVLMPSYVNIGAYVGAGTMVDTWATVGSCAQVGKNVHLSGGVGLGGVLEPPGARPVIIEDGCFVGSRCIVVEGMHLEEEVVLGANVVLTSSVKIIDVSGDEAVEHRGRVPARSVVIPGSIPKKFNAGTFNVGCALIIGKRKASTDKKTTLNEALRDFNVSV
jgi:2,3,4,5-tetrahydropyridine-2-carboxylate N-succinyltransferase